MVLTVCHGDLPDRHGDLPVRHGDTLKSYFGLHVFLWIELDWVVLGTIRWDELG